MGIISVKHAFAAGDLLTILPGFKKLFKETGKKTVIYQQLGLFSHYYEGAVYATQDGEGNNVCMNERLWGMLVPLLKAQEYIEDARVWKGEEVDYDFDLTRMDKNIPMPHGDIYSWSWATFPELMADISEDWIEAGLDKRVRGLLYMDTINGGSFFISDAIIINRTLRYQNPYISYYFLKKYANRLLFSGTQNERDAFCKQWELDIPLIRASNFLHVARVLKNCKLFLGNQSLHFHLCQSMHVPRILELNAMFPNTFPVGRDGYGFYKQKSLEYYVEKLMNE